MPMTTYAQQFAIAAPEILVFSVACVILIVDLFLSDRTRIVSYLLAQAGLVATFALTLAGMTDTTVHAFHGLFVRDPMADILKLGIYAAVFVAFVYSRDYLAERGLFRGEYYVMGLLGTCGMMVMVSASNFLTLYLGLELLSLNLYALVAFNRDSPLATEAAMKYFVLGAIASGMLLFGMSMLYGATGSLDLATVHAAIGKLTPKHIVLVFGLVFVVVGLAFKVGAVPFHMWIPDVYQGAPTSVVVYIGSAPKIAAFAMIMRLLVGGLGGLSVSWQGMLIILAILSMGLGNVVAIAQTNIKRMLAYSTISHMGFFLLGILSATKNGYGSSMFYVLVYALMSLGVFGVIILLSRQGYESDQLDDFRGLGQRSPWAAFLMLLLMFSMAGVPPTLGFYAKLMVIQSLVDQGLIWLAIVAVLMAVVGAYYYLRVVKLMYFDEPVDAPAVEARSDMRAVLSLNAIGVIALIPWVGSLIELCREAVRAIS